MLLYTSPPPFYVYAKSILQKAFHLTHLANGNMYVKTKLSVKEMKSIPRGLHGL